MNDETLALFKPLEWQIAPWKDKSPILLLTGSAGGGKSRLAAEKLHAFCLKYPGAMGLMLRKTRESMVNSTVLFMQRSIIAEDPRVQCVLSKSRFEYWNGSILAWGGMKDDGQREQIRSIGQTGGLDMVWMEEATRFTEDDLNEVLGRMRGRSAPWMQVMLSTNPGAPAHWIKKRLIDGGEAAVYYSRAADNPHNPAAYVDNLGRLTGILGERLREGRWVQAEGAIYGEFRDELHVVEPFPIPANWRRLRSVDFGYTNPFVCQWWAVDNDGRMYLYREVYMSRRTVRRHTDQILELSQGEGIEATVADHDAEDRATMAEGGIKTVPAQKAVSPGLQEVMNRLKVAGDGRPRLFLFRGATVEVDQALEDDKLPTSTLEELPLYRWEDKAKKEAPVKEHDHGMDAMRYAAMYFRKGRPKAQSIQG
jgi:phage terminase large subunit